VKPYYDHAGITIYNADFRDILPSLNPLDFSALVVDPPYGIGYKSNGGGTQKADHTAWWFGKKIEGDKDTRYRDEILTWWGDGPAFVFGSWKVQRPVATRTVLIYDKGGASGMGDLSIPFKPSHEEIYVLGKGFVGNRDCGSVLQGRIQCTASRGRLHTTEKDWRTMRVLLGKVLLGAVIDPCIGVGPVLVAAKETHRKAIGIEIEERYCEIAAKRLAQEMLSFYDADEYERARRNGMPASGRHG